MLLEACKEYKMKKIIALLGLVSLPVFSAPPILDTDLLEAGENMLSGGYRHLELDMEGYTDISVGGDIDQSASDDELSLVYGYGFTKNQMLTLEIPYTYRGQGKASFNFTDGSTVKTESSTEGLGDLSVEYKFLLPTTESYRIAAWLGATIPVGDDDAGDPEIIENGTKTQSLKKGGAGSGRTDFELGLSYSTLIGSSTLFSSVAYRINGSKTEEGDKEEPGDDVFLRVGVLQAFDAKSSLGADLIYGYTRQGKDGDSDISSNSTYGASLAYFFHATNNFILSPQLGYLKMSNQTRTDRTDNAKFKLSDIKAIFLSINFRKTF